MRAALLWARRSFGALENAERAGLALVVLSALAYLGLLVVPFTPLDFAGKAALAAGLVIGGEALFWLGALVAGRSVMRKYREWLSPRRILMALERLDEKK